MQAVCHGTMDSCPTLGCGCKVRVRKVIVSEQLLELLRRTRRPKVLVIGDVMLDRYLWGDVDRISPEAPIPVLRVVESEERLGGAGSVVTLLGALGADVLVGTVTADDPEGQRVRRLLDQQGVPGDCVLVDENRTTTVKERMLGRTQSRHPQQILRVDRETTRPIDDHLAQQLLDSLRPYLGEVDVVLVSDYEKGVCAGSLLEDLTDLAREASVPVLADPACGVDYDRYRSCTCVTPNRHEAGMALGRKIKTPEDGVQAARDLLSFGFQAAVVTMDQDGIAWADDSGRSRLFPVRPRQVYDITGAGDMVLVALGYGLAAGGDWPAAIELANLAGGLEVERLGVAPVSRGDLAAEISHDGSSAKEEEKILTEERLVEELRRLRRSGQRIAMTNGCFDLLHPGHIASLDYARHQGDCLVVGLNSDRSVQELKGAGHPVIPERDRAEMLAALACVDYVVIFDDASVDGLVRTVAPDVLVKSGEYAPDQVVGHQSVLEHGGRVAIAPMKGDYSTSSLIRQIERMCSEGESAETPEPEPRANR